MLLPKNLKKFAEYITEFADTYSGEKLGEIVEQVYLKLNTQNDRDLREEANKKQSH